MGRKSVKDLLMYEETLFQEERVFDPDYVPRDFNHRDAQLQEIAFCLRPALKGGRPANARITGPPATGKTTAVKLMFEEVEAQTDRVACVHVNCQVHSSKFSVFSQIHKKVVGHLPPETGVPFPKVYDAIFGRLRREKKSLVVALDDMNYLFYDRHANDILYQILRAHELHPGAKTAVIGVVSDMEFNIRLDSRVSSVYKPREIFFQPYSLHEMEAILKDRAELGFYPGVIGEEVVAIVAKHAFERGDLRIGIELLRLSALRAEAEASRHIEAEHVADAVEGSRLVSLAQTLETLGMEELMLMRLIAEAGRMNSGELYELYKVKAKQSYTKFYRSLDKLEALRLVDTKFTGEGRRGRTREVVARFLRDEVNKALEK